ncbi:MAG: hypothetical protein A2W25_05020 [candidate division Zixibacteria bacterium RBG_16_53_22]|nr:MAG: hypothetical protein A2W25_05020 [candidate division Zixibacteria bacterium RBG_16_53_22]
MDKEYLRRYYQAHAGEIAEKQRRYYQAHAGELAEKRRRYYQAHAGEIADKQRVISGATCIHCGAPIKKGNYPHYCSRQCYLATFDKYRIRARV